MPTQLKQVLEELPPPWPEDLGASLRDEFTKSGKTIVVLDDDPTGTQTSSNVTVLTSWSVELIAAELRKHPAVLFILTNSRSLSEQEAIALTYEIGHNVKQASAESNRAIILISRSDSTLRGHFPAEVDALVQVMDMPEAVIVLIPAFIEGGRITIDDIHYLIENDELIPVSMTPFARDAVFGYKNANLKQWVEEKTNGRIRADEVASVSLEDIRVGGPQLVSTKLMSCKAGSVCIINAVSFGDLEVVAMGLMMAERAGRQFLYRTSATIIPIRTGADRNNAYIPAERENKANHGALVVVGSHVPKSTAQLKNLLSIASVKVIEVNVEEVLLLTDSTAWAKTIGSQTDKWLSDGDTVVLYTSRQLKIGDNKDSSLKISAIVSDFLVRILQNLTVRPAFIIAKGGITASDLATKGLSAEKAFVAGPILPGVPVWHMDENSKFPHICYVVFPGNVGSETALTDVYRMLSDR